MRNIAIVTGASSGLGEDFVKLLDAGSGGPLDEIWLIARKKEQLDAVAAKLSTPSRVMPLDLTDPASFTAVEDALKAEDDPNVQWLFNCAGFGKFGDFESIGRQQNANMVRLNCLAVLEMSYVSLPFMHAGSRIVNIASAAALVPQPGLSTYGATKRFVLDLSRALNFELDGTGIHVSAVCPKFMHTRFLDDPGNQAEVRHFTWIGFEDADACAATALRKAIRGKDCIFTSPDVALMNIACKLLPVDLVMAIERAIGNWYAKAA